MADKTQPQGFAKAKASGEGFASRKATEDDDVEGHSIHRASEGFAKAKADGGEGFASRKATEDDDAEGHSMLLNPLVAREMAQARERDVQQNLKRHGYENDARAAKKDRR